MVPVAILSLLVFFFFVSWWVENLVAKRLLHEIESKTVRTATLYANLITYGILETLAFGWLVAEVFFVTHTAAGS